MWVVFAVFLSFTAVVFAGPGKGHPIQRGDKGRQEPAKGHLHEGRERGTKATLRETKGDKGKQAAQEPGKGHPRDGDKGRQRETKGDKGRQDAQEPDKGHPHEGR